MVGQRFWHGPMEMFSKIGKQLACRDRSVVVVVVRHNVALSWVECLVVVDELGRAMCRGVHEISHEAWTVMVPV